MWGLPSDSEGASRPVVFNYTFFLRGSVRSNSYLMELRREITFLFFHKPLQVNTDFVLISFDSCIQWVSSEETGNRCQMAPVKISCISSGFRIRRNPSGIVWRLDAHHKWLKSIPFLLHSCRFLGLWPLLYVSDGSELFQSSYPPQSPLFLSHFK